MTALAYQARHGDPGVGQDDTLTRHTCSGSGWAVWSQHCGPSFTALSPHDPQIDVLVGDGPPGGTRAPVSRIAARLHKGGRVILDAHAAPPALHIAREGIWLLPAMGGAEHRLAAGDRLLLWSAGALEAHPSRLVTVLHREASDLLTLPPDVLVSSALSGEGCGAAAVAVFLAARGHD